MGGDARVVLKIGTDEFNAMINGRRFNREIDVFTGMEADAGASGGLFKGSLFEIHTWDTLSTSAASAF